MADKSTLLQEIARFGRIFSKQRTLSCQQVLTLYREPGVLTGYRPSGKSWFYYLLSIFQINNETVNIWTHAIAVVINISQLVLIYSREGIVPEVRNVFIFFQICTTANVLISAIVHAFHSKSPRMHYTLFQMDYAGIGIFGLGKSILFLHTSCPPEVHGVVKHISLPVNMILALVLMTGCCMAKLLYRRPYPIERKFMQLGSGMLLTIFGSLPISTRYAKCFIDSECSMSSMNHHTFHVLTLGMSMFFFSCHLPEKKLQGRFDIIGQGHHFFHVLVVMTSYLQYEAAVNDVIHNQPDKWLVSAIDPITVGCMFLAYLLGSGVVIWCLSGRVTKRIEQDLKMA